MTGVFPVSGTVRARTAPTAAIDGATGEGQG